MKTQKAFTIVELLIVVVVIAILAAVTIVSYSGIQSSARDSKIANDIQQVNKLILLYHAKNGHYPITENVEMGVGSGGPLAMMDEGCTWMFGQSAQGDRATAEWVPGLDVPLPQSDHNIGGGITGAQSRGCYVYTSDGDDYVLSAWNMLRSPQEDLMYRRIGFRESTLNQSQFYYCNQITIGGTRLGAYDTGWDYYKHSYTITSVSWCDETAP